MRLYHGSPKNINILKPQKAKGLNSFENMTALFLTETFLHAALYAIGKTLRGTTAFAVTENRLIIIGHHPLRKGYVYEVEVKNTIKGHCGQYAVKNKLLPLKKCEVVPEDYRHNILYVKNRKELIASIRT